MKKTNLYKPFTAALLAAATVLSGCGSTASTAPANAETETTENDAAETAAEDELSAEDIYYQYVNDRLVSKYGLANLDPQNGNVTDMTDYWLNPCGIYSAYIADIDADGEKEMTVFRYAQSEEEDGWPGDSYCLYADVFAQENGEVVLKDSQKAALYDKYDITTLGQAEFCSTNIYVTAVTLDDRTDFVITGVQDCAVDWADGINRDAWAINFDGEKLNFDFGLIETEGGSEDPIYSDYEAGSDPVEYLNYRDNDLDESYEAALAEFLQDHGVTSAVYTEVGSPVAESDNAVRILELIVSAAGGDGDAVNFVFEPTDKTDLRTKLSGLEDSSANDFSGLVTATLNESGNVANCGDYSYVIPQINLEGSEIDALNKQIYDKYIKYYNETMADPENGWRACSGIFYEWAVADGKLSIVIYVSLYPDASGWDEPEVFTIDIESAHVCTQQELMDYFGMSEKYYRTLAKDAMGNSFCVSKSDSWRENSFGMEQFEKTIADDNIDLCVLYMNSEGHPGIYSRQYSMAAGDYYPILIDLTIYVIDDWFDENYGPSLHFEGSSSDLSEYKGSSEDASAAGTAAVTQSHAAAAASETSAAATIAASTQAAAETTAAAAQTTAVQTTAAAQTQAQAASDGSYLIPGSDSRYITEADIAGMSSDTIQLAINEIYARHGRRFDRADVQAYFDSKSWYHGTISSAAFDESVFNEYEWDNIDFLVAHK